MRKMASRHRGIMASRRGGFSLIEVLLAIFILGIGIISIAALFPAGIAQQRQSVDDVMGPLVAENALAVLRSKLSQEDFGTFEEFDPDPLNPTVFAPRYTIPGDWPWRRPAFLRSNARPNKWRYGAIDIFNGIFHGTATASTENPGGYPGSVPALDAVPFSTTKYGITPPAIIFTQQERLYPQSVRYYPTLPADKRLERLPRSQYAWDCMFRRFQGKVLVAIFVYRVTVPGGETADYKVAESISVYPPLPVWVDLANGPGSEPWRGYAWNAFGDDINDPTDDALIFGTYPGDDFDITNQAHQWQVAGQWLLDQNNNVHRVLSGRQSINDGPVELVRPVPALPPSYDPQTGWQWPAVPAYYMLPNSDGATNIVTDIWYLPLTVENVNGQEFRLTPVYLTVKEL
jgi:type II secretory pathway pseudopilin PulG